MFRFTKKPSSGRHNRAWLKIQAWFNVDTDVVQTLSVLWRLKPVAGFSLLIIEVS